MSDKELGTNVRAIHQGVINEIGAQAAILLLGVARDLRDGTIPPENYIQSSINCGSAHCIFGWVALRMDDPWQLESFIHDWDKSSRLKNLFASWSDCTTEEAANAIERYVFDYAKRPWAVSVMLRVRK